MKGKWKRRGGSEGCKWDLGSIRAVLRDCAGWGWTLPDEEKAYCPGGPAGTVWRLCHPKMSLVYGGLGLSSEVGTHLQERRGIIRKGLFQR